MTTIFTPHVAQGMENDAAIGQKTSRPASLFELRKKILDYSWDASKPLSFLLQLAGALRREGKVYAVSNPERAFVALGHAANIILVKLPTHRDYATILTDTQRDNLHSVCFFPRFLVSLLMLHLQNGSLVLGELSKIRKIVVQRYNNWATEHPEEAKEVVFNLREKQGIPFDVTADPVAQDQLELLLDDDQDIGQLEIGGDIRPNPERFTRRPMLQPFTNYRPGSSVSEPFSSSSSRTMRTTLRPPSTEHSAPIQRHILPSATRSYSVLRETPLESGYLASSQADPSQGIPPFTSYRQTIFKPILSSSSMTRTALRPPSNERSTPHPMPYPVPSDRARDSTVLSPHSVLSETPLESGYNPNIEMINQERSRGPAFQSIPSFPSHRSSAFRSSSSMTPAMLRPPSSERSNPYPMSYRSLSDRTGNLSMGPLPHSLLSETSLDSGYTSNAGAFSTFTEKSCYHTPSSFPSDQPLTEVLLEDRDDPENDNPSIKDPQPAPLVPQPSRSSFPLPFKRFMKKQQEQRDVQSNASPNTNPISFDIKRKMKSRRKVHHVHSTSESSTRFDTEGFWSSFPSE
ncbi:hypothetical protein M413DRAFT_25689 [Hebeloma cylindrosporum]|uniref:Uncharacterized protein n=1 Tax=Hebeloma cylindrosporum TaxID=76867 RepID=A0A0C2YTD1_HEBCY|nr:hypothetical protein M413DRAFT_25689 [Hebeloma cylindrosporum h7]